MAMQKRFPPSDTDEDAALRSILEGTAKETGEQFFAALVKALAGALGTRGAWVTEFVDDGVLRAFAFWWNGEWIPDYTYSIDGTPCEDVVHEGRLVHHPDNVGKLFPADVDIEKLNAVSYIGTPLLGARGQVLGNLAVMDTQPLAAKPRSEAVIRIFAARAAAEVERLQADRAVREREDQLSRLVNSAMDAIIQLDRELRVVRVNPATEKVYQCTSERLVGEPFTRFLTEEASRRLRGFVEELDARETGEQFLWVPGGLEAVRSGGEMLPAEVTLSRFEVDERPFYTLILRDVNDRLAAERRIRSLTAETESLREEIRALSEFGEIVGESESLRRALKDVEQVASTDSTVLILGETGTGKELFARAIHGASGRAERPLVKVNCAAIPANLIESEFFGHEKGAFTGATQKRDGRFALADGATIFLDEVGELPVDLQVKLLRVLQEGEFDPVGSAQTRKVDVRVIAATNRDLEERMRAGEFREDLYYRLHVFPVHVPPLRERDDDIVLLARAFLEKLAAKLGRVVEPLSESDARRLKAYAWPGNVRELQNVIERAVITSRQGRLELDRILPECADATEMDMSVAIDPTAVTDRMIGRILTAPELQELERANTLRALEATGWKVSGKDGAAQLLSMKPSTLSSRMRALGIRRR